MTTYQLALGWSYLRHQATGELVLQHERSDLNRFNRHFTTAAMGVATSPLHIPASLNSLRHNYPG